MRVFFEKSDKKYVLNRFEVNLKIWKFGVEEKFNFDESSLNDVFDKIYEGIEAVVRDGKSQF